MVKISIFCVPLCTSLLLLIFPVHSQLVRGKPPLFENQPKGYPAKSLVNGGQPFHVSCPTDQSDVEISWIKNGSAIGHLAKDLQIPSVTPEDSAVYHCIVKNAFGAVLSPPTVLKVQYLHDFTDGEDRTVTVSKDRPVVLKRPDLIASSDLEVLYTWYRNDVEVYTNNTHYVTSRGDLVLTGGNGYTGMYRVTASVDDLGEAASGVYQVEESVLGSEEIPSFTIVYGPEDSTVELNDSSRPISFDCVPSFSDGVRVNWLLDGTPLTDNRNEIVFQHQQRRIVIKDPVGLFKGKSVVNLECRADAAAGRVFDQKKGVITILVPPRLGLLPSELTKPLGDTLVMKCSVKEGSREYTTVQWWHNGVKIPSPSGIVSVPSLNNKDFGVYQCEGNNPAGHTLSTIWLHEGPGHNEGHTVATSGLWGFDDSSAEEFRPTPASTIEVTVPKIVGKPEDVQAKAGETASFTCSAEGHPRPVIFWKFNDNRLRGESSKYDLSPGRLTIRDLKASDSGQYICEVENDGGKSEEIAVLTVIGVSLIENGPTNQSILIGTNIEIPCEVAKEFEGKVDVQWSLNDEPVGPSGNSALRLFRNQKGGLLIRQVGPDNIGEYRCTVRANALEQSQSAWLRIIEKPSMPVAVTAQLINDTVPAKVRVSWREGFDGNSPIIRHSIEMRTLGPTSQWGVWEIVVDSVPPENCCSWMIDNLKPSVTAEFRVIGSNRYGAGMPSLPSHNVTMPQQPPAAAPKGVAASARSSSSIMVQWQPPAAEQWNGDILGYMVRYRLAGYTLPWNDKNVTNTHVRNVAIEPLITWREYEIQVAAYNHRGLGVFSKSIYVTTLEGVPTQSPKRVTLEVVNSTAVRVSFKAPDQQRIPGVNLGYKVQFWKGVPGRGQLHKQVVVDPVSADLSVLVDGLEKWGHYNVSILCYTAPGEGPRSEPLLVVTEEDIPGGVSDLNIDQDQVMSNSAVVEWGLPRESNGLITGYELRFWRSDTPDDHSVLTLPGSVVNTTLEGLTPSTKYGVEIRASTVKGAGPWAETHFESGVPPELPGRPSSLSVTDVQARSVELHFKPGFDGHTVIRQWIVEARMGDSSIFHTIYNISSPKARSITVDGLRPFTRYQLRLIAENVVGRGAPSEATKTFETLPTNPDIPPSRLWSEPISATSLVISWSPLQQWQWNGQPKGYLIVYRQNGTQQWKEVRTALLRATEFTIRDLMPFTTYEVDLFAENVFGRSPSFGVTTTKTYESAPSGAPQNVKAESDSQRAVSVQWTYVDSESRNGEILGYKVRLVPELPALRQEFEKVVDVVGEAQLQTKVSSLRPFTSYHVFVSAYTVVGHGPENSTPTIVHTGADLPSEPSNVGFVLVSEEEVRLKWLPPDMPNGKIKAYTVTYWRLDEDRSTAITVPIISTSYAFTANGLNANTKYRFTVSAENEVGTGPEAIAEVVTTSVRLPVRNPPPPSRDERKAFSSSEISIGWAPLVETEEDAPIRFVQIEYQKANDADWTPFTESIPATVNKVTIPRLRPNTAYRVRIRMKGDFQQSSWSSESEWIKTLSDRPQAPPTQLSASPYESNGLLLQWMAPERVSWNSDVLGYKIFYRPYPSNDSWRSEEIPPQHDVEQRAQTVIRNLQSFRHYIVNMRSLNPEGVSEPSSPVFVYVGYSIPRGNVTGLSVEPSSSTSLSLRWDPWNDKDDVITGFKIRYTPLVSVLSPESREEQLVIVENNTALLTDLLKYTQYQVSVSPYNRAGEGGMAVVRESTLQDVPGPVGDLVFSDILLDSVNVSWTVPTQPNGRIVRYIVNYNTYKLQDEFLKNIKQPTQMTFIVAAGLEEGATYYFSVRAESGAGPGPETTGNVTIGPSPDGPRSPLHPSVVPGHTSFTLQWKEEDMGREVIGHIVQAKRVANAVDSSISPPPSPPSHSSSKQPRRKRSYDPPTHRMGEWITLSTIMGKTDHYEIGYHDLHPSSYYVFRVFARNHKGIGRPSEESGQLFVPASLPEDPFYTQMWFIGLVAMATLVVVVCVVAFLCVTGSAAKYDREKRRRSIDSLQLADGNLATFQLKQGGDNRISRSRNDLLTRPATTTSWISDRDPPAYGSVLGGERGVNMYGQLATDTMPGATGDVAAMQRLSVLAGRDVRGSAYATYRGGEIASPRREADEMTDGFDDSFDEEESVQSEREPTARGDIAGHYAHSDHYSATWRRVRDEAVSSSHPSNFTHLSSSPHRIGVPPPPPSHRPPRPDSNGTGSGGSEGSWPSQQAPALEKGFSSFV